MRWPLFLIALLLAVAFDTSLARVLSFDPLGADIRPSASACLAVFMALSAQRSSALWACLLLGLALDLSQILHRTGIDTHYLLGPHALGYIFGGYLIHQARSIVFRRRALTIGFLAAAFFFAAGLVGIAIHVIRSWYAESLPWAPGSTAGALIRCFLSALYTGLLAVPLGWALVRSTPLWGFHQGARHRNWR